MKSILAIITALLMALSFTGCRSFQKDTKDTDKAEASKTEETAYAQSKQVCTVGNISFEVPAKWEQMDGHDGTFISPDKKNVYQLQGESMLGSYTPDEFFQHLIETYASSYEIVRKEKGVSPLTTPDGTECFAGKIELNDGNAFFSIDVLAAPSKNTVLTFAAQCAKGSYPDTDIRSVTETTVFNIGTEDMASGKNFKLSVGTEIHLEDDGKFKYFKESGNKDDNYFDGTYEVYYGQSAFNKLVSMTEYGLTEEELESTLSANMNGYSIGGSSLMDYFNSDEAYGENGYRICKDTFYAIIMDTQTLHENGDVSDFDGQAVYMGYYIPELSEFDLLSVNTYTYTQWTEIK